MLDVAAKRMVYASEEDWERHKDTVIRLYWNENRTLREVMDTMKRDSGFNGTTRMYKSRFKNWGLVKNMSRQETSRIKSKLHATGEDPVIPLVHGREIGSKRLKQDIDRARREQSMTFDNVDSSRQPLIISPGSLSHRLRPPKSLAEAELAVRSGLSYTRYSFETGNWDLPIDDFVTRMDNTAAWWLDARKAAALLETRADYRSAFAQIDACLNRYVELLVQPDPSFVTATLSVILQLGETNRELAESILKYVAGLTAIKLGSNHPLAALWAYLRFLGLSQMRQAAVMTMKAHYNMLEYNMQANHQSDEAWDSYPAKEPESYNKFPKQMTESSTFTTIMQEVENNSKSEIDKAYIDWSRKMLSYYLQKGSQSAEAKEGIKQKGQGATSGGYSQDDYLRARHHSVSGMTESMACWLTSARRS
ncbi:hypothetical protein SCUP515_09213 [Seiridium cupressi]